MPNETSLSERELDVVRLMAHGYSYAVIADRLSVSPETVKTHVRHIYEKLELDGRGQVCDWYWELRY